MMAPVFPVSVVVTVLACAVSSTLAAGMLRSVRIDTDSDEFYQTFKRPSFKLDVQGVDNICRSEACVARAAMMQQAMNKSADPCDNFFEHACGNWVSLNPIPPEYASWGTMKQIQQQLNTKLQGLMESKTKDASTARQKSKQLFKACKNLSAFEEAGSKPLLKVMKNMIGGWPLLDSSWDANRFDVLDMYTKFSQAGMTFIQTIFTAVDVYQPRRNVLFFDEMSLGLSAKTMYTDPSMEKIRKAYMILMKTLTTLLSEDIGVALPDDLDEQLQEIFDFETSIAKLSFTSQERRDPSKIFNYMPLNDFLDKHFNKTFMKKNFLTMIRNIPLNATLANAIQLNMTVNVVNTRYHEGIDEIWSKRLNGPHKAKTGKRFIAKYLGWRLLLDASSVLSKRYRDAIFEFKKGYSGVTQDAPRWLTCVNYANGAMPLAVGSIFVNEYFGMDAKAKLLPVLRDVKAAFKTIVKESKWMDDQTRERALKKLAAMTEYIAYPDFLLLDLPRLDSIYEDYHITDTHYLNTQNIDRHATLQNLEQLLKPNIQNVDESTSPIEVNGYYAIDKNMIAIMAGLLQPPMFHKDYPAYLNYAAIGQDYGHELTHGFDDGGSLFDEEGKMTTWWTNSSRANFKSRAQSIIDQYSAYKTSAGNINGALTAGENIADNGGVKEAYMAYKQYMSRLNSTMPQRLPGFEHLSVEKVYFLASAQTWCGYYRPEYMKNRVLLDVHSPYQYRVNGPNSNLQGFAKAFDCPVGSTMNPVKKAGVW